MPTVREIFDEHLARLEVLTGGVVPEHKRLWYEAFPYSLLLADYPRTQSPVIEEAIKIVDEGHIEFPSQKDGDPEILTIQEIVAYMAPESGKTVDTWMALMRETGEYAEFIRRVDAEIEASGVLAPGQTPQDYRRQIHDSSQVVNLAAFRDIVDTKRRATQALVMLDVRAIQMANALDEYIRDELQSRDETRGKPYDGLLDGVPLEQHPPMAMALLLVRLSQMPSRAAALKLLSHVQSSYAVTVLEDEELQELLGDQLSTHTVLEMMIDEDRSLENIVYLFTWSVWPESKDRLKKLKILLKENPRSLPSISRVTNMNFWMQLVMPPGAVTEDDEAWELRVVKLLRMAAIVAGLGKGYGLDMVDNQAAERAIYLQSLKESELLEYALLVEGFEVSAGEKESYWGIHPRVIRENVQTWMWANDAKESHASWVDDFRLTKAAAELPVPSFEKEKARVNMMDCLGQAQMTLLLEGVIAIHGAQSAVELQIIVQELTTATTVYSPVTVVRLISFVSAKLEQEGWQLPAQDFMSTFSSNSARNFCLALENNIHDTAVWHNRVLADVQLVEQAITKTVAEQPELTEDHWVVVEIRQHLAIYQKNGTVAFDRLLAKLALMRAPLTSQRVKTDNLEELLRERPASPGLLRAITWCRMWIEPETSLEVLEILLESYTNDELDALETSDYEYFLYVFGERPAGDQFYLDIKPLHQEFREWEQQVPFIYRVEGKDQSKIFEKPIRKEIWAQHKKELIQLQLTDKDTFYAIRDMVLAHPAHYLGLREAILSGQRFCDFRYRQTQPPTYIQDGGGEVQATAPTIEMLTEFFDVLGSHHRANTEPKRLATGHIKEDLISRQWTKIHAIWFDTYPFARDIFITLLRKLISDGTDYNDFQKEVFFFEDVARKYRSRELLLYFYQLGDIDKFEFWAFLKTVYKTSLVGSHKKIGELTLSDFEQAVAFIRSFNGLVMPEIYFAYLDLETSISDDARACGIDKTGEAGRQQLRTCVLDLRQKLLLDEAYDWNPKNGIHMSLIRAISRSGSASFKVTGLERTIQQVADERKAGKRALPAGFVPARVIYVDTVDTQSAVSEWQPHAQTVKLYKQLNDDLAWLAGGQSALEFQGSFRNTFLRARESELAGLLYQEVMVAMDALEMYASYIPSDRAAEQAALSTWITAVKRIVSKLLVPNQQDILVKLQPHHIIDVLYVLLHPPSDALSGNSAYQQLLRRVTLLRVVQVELEKMSAGSTSNLLQDALGESMRYADITQDAIQRLQDLYVHRVLGENVTEVFDFEDVSDAVASVVPGQQLDMESLKRSCMRMWRLSRLTTEIQAIARHTRNTSGGKKLEMVIVSTTGLMAELIGQVADMCLAGRQIVTDQGNTVALVYVTGLDQETVKNLPGYQAEPDFEVVRRESPALQGGGVCVMIPDVAGNMTIHISGQNPLQTFVREIVPDDLVVQVHEGVVVPAAVERGMTIVVPQDGYQDTESNRHDIIEAHRRLVGSNPEVKLADYVLFGSNKNAKNRTFVRYQKP